MLSLITFVAPIFVLENNLSQLSEFNLYLQEFFLSLRNTETFDKLFSIIALVVVGMDEDCVGIIAL